MKSNVIGPILPADWLTLQMLHSSINYMKTKDTSKFRMAIDKETLIYKEILSVYLTAANDNEVLQKAA